MIFAISRHSDDDIKKPIEGSYRKNLTYTKEYPEAKTLAQLYEKYGIGRAGGFNFRIDGGRVIADFEEDRWVIDVNSLEDLTELIKRAGNYTIMLNVGGLCPIYRFTEYQGCDGEIQIADEAYYFG
jgi:hypothetical protein